MTEILAALSKDSFVDNVKVKQLVCFPDVSAVIHKESIVRNSTLAFDPLLHTYRHESENQCSLFFVNFSLQALLRITMKDCM